MGRIRRTVHISAGPEEVFAYMDDVKRRGGHMLGMGRDFSPEILSENETGVGATYRWRGKMYGAKFGWTEVVTKWVKNRQKSQHSLGGSGWLTQLDTGWTLAPADGGTDLTLAMDYRLGYSFLGKLLDRLWLERYCSNGVALDFQHMREALEKPGEAAVEVGQAAREVTA